MSNENTPAGTSLVSSRRRLLGGFGTATLSVGAVALLAGCQGTAETRQSAGQGDAAADAAVLNVALGLEHEAIAAYQLGAGSGLLQPAVLETAVLFQGHHKEHRDLLAKTIVTLGGTPVQPKADGFYAEKLQADTLKSQADVLVLAHRLEEQAANAYLGVIPSFRDPKLAQVAGRLATDETMHWTALTQAIGRSIPERALSLGA